jgi:hypothetical protein
MNLDVIREELTDFFARMHHEIEVARSRADSVVAIVQRHAQAEIAFVLDCSPQACGAIFGSDVEEANGLTPPEVQ